MLWSANQNDARAILMTSQDHDPSDDTSATPSKNTEKTIDRRELETTERRSIGLLALLALAIAVWIAAPVGVGILLGTLMAFMLQPLYEKWKEKLGGTLSSLATVFVAALTLALITGGLTWLFISKGTALARLLLDALGPSGGTNGVVDKVGRLTSRFGIGPEQLQDRLRGAVGAAAERAAATAEALLAATATSILALFFAALTMHFILRNWHSMLKRAQEALPIRPRYTLALFQEFQRVGRATLLGTIVTGLAQGLFATIGYLICGVPQPLFFGAVTAVASLIPAVGTLLIWVPIGIVLILTQHTLGGIVELIWGALLIVGASDYVIRPRLVGGDGEMPALITFTALFGGVEVFGLKGLIVGPVLMSLAFVVLEIYAKEMRERRAALATDNYPTRP